MKVIQKFKILNSTIFVHFLIRQMIQLGVEEVIIIFIWK
jgi:hypothetical protein